MKALTAILVGIALSACSASYTVSTPPKPEITDMGTFSQKVHFIELMEVVRDNFHQAPTPGLKEKVNRLMFEAGLRQECANKRCWLQHKHFRIRTDEDFIIIELNKNTVVKVDINEPDRAARVIYG